MARLCSPVLWAFSHVTLQVSLFYAAPLWFECHTLSSSIFLGFQELIFMYCICSFLNPILCIYADRSSSWRSWELQGYKAGRLIVVCGQNLLHKARKHHKFMTKKSTATFLLWNLNPTWCPNWEKTSTLKSHADLSLSGRILIVV